MPLSAYRIASGARVHQGDKGKVYPPRGEKVPHGSGVICVSRAALHGVDSHLWAALKVAVDLLAVAINVNSIDTGEHTTNSRHYAGMAVDINRIGQKIGNWLPVTAHNPLAIDLVDLFLRSGWQIGEGEPTRAGILLGPPHTRWNPTSSDHGTHLHLSVARHA